MSAPPPISSTRPRSSATVRSNHSTAGRTSPSIAPARVGAASPTHLRTTPTTRRRIRTGRARSLSRTALASKNSARARARWRSKSSARRRVRFTTASAARTAHSSPARRPPSMMAACSRRVPHTSSASSEPARSSAPCRRSSRTVRSPPSTTAARILPVSSAILIRMPMVWRSIRRPNPGKPQLPPVVIDAGRTCLPSQRPIRGKCVDRPLVAACRSTEKRVNGKCVSGSASTACPVTIRSA